MPLKYSPKSNSKICGKHSILPKSPTYGEPVFPRIGPSHKHTSPRIDHNSLVTAPRIDGCGDVVSLLCQTRSHRGLKSGFEQHFLAGMAEAWRLSGLLRIHAEIDEVDQRLNVTLRLIISTHD